MPNVHYELTGDSTSLERAARKGEGALGALTREQARNQKATEGQTKSIRTAVNNLNRLAPAAGAAGASLGKLNGVVEFGQEALGDMGAKLALGVSAIGAWAIGVTTATTAVASHLISTSRALDDTIERLEELGASPLDKRVEESVRGVKDASDGLEGQILTLRTELAALASVELTGLIQVGAGVVETLRRMNDVMSGDLAQGLKDIAQDISRVTVAIASMGASESFLGELRRRGADAADSITDLKDETESYEDVLKRLGPLVSKTDLEAPFKAAERAAKDAADAAKKHLDLMKEMERQAREDEALGQRMAEDEAERIERLREMAEEDIAKREKMENDNRRRVQQARQKEAKEQEEFEEEERERMLAGLALARDTSIATVATSTSAIMAMAEESSGAWKAAFLANKAAALASVIVNTAAGIMAAQTVPPPAGQILATAIGVQGAAQAAIIGAQTAEGLAHDGAPLRERRHTGGSLAADEIPLGPVTARQGEGAFVFSQGAMEAGAMEQAQAINEGASMGRGVRLVLADAGRVIGEALILDSKRPGSPTAVGSGAAFRNVYG